MTNRTRRLLRLCAEHAWVYAIICIVLVVLCHFLVRT